MAELVKIFSDPNLPSKARFRCGVEGPDELDVLFESIIDDQFGHDSNSEYKLWVRRLYRLGLISTIPSEWVTSEEAGRGEPVDAVLLNETLTDLLGESRK
jgi:hypothetical protein